MHVCDTGSPFERSHLLPRDHLRLSAAARDAQAQAGARTAATWSDGCPAYTEAKDEGIARLPEETADWAQHTRWSAS